MRTFSLLLALAVAGCGGGAVPSSQPPPVAAAAAVRTVDATNRAEEYGTLWVAWTTSATVYDIHDALTYTNTLPAYNAIGTISSGPGPGTIRKVADIAVGSDGASYALVNISTDPLNNGSDSWKLKIYASNAGPATPYEQIITGTGKGVAVALDYNVIDVLVSDGTQNAPHGRLESYRYASGNSPSPVRTVTFPYAPGYLALDQRGQAYVQSGPRFPSIGTEHIFVYGRQIGGAAPAPIRTITLPPNSSSQFALGPSGAVWSSTAGTVLTNPAGAEYAYEAVNSLNPGNDGPNPDVTIGYVNKLIDAVAVDQYDNVYVGYHGVSYVGFIDMYPNGGTRGSVAFTPPASTPAVPIGLLTALTVGPPPGASANIRRRALGR